MNEARLSIPVDQIHVPEDRVRSFDEAAARALSIQIAQNGQLTPVIVYKSTARHDDKRFTLICGERRLWAMKYLGLEIIDATLRTAAEAPMLEITDHIAAPSSDALEEGEFLQAYRCLWQEENGLVSRGGIRGAKGHNVPLESELNFLKKSGFFNHLEIKFQISKKTAQRRLAIGRMDKVLRDRLRGTGNTRDQSLLLKVAALPQAERQGIFAALAFEPDLKKVLRMDDPATGRKGVGRMETGDWRESGFIEAWQKLPLDRRAAALDKIGAMPKLVERWPEPLPVRGIRASGDMSPLWEAMKDPYATLYNPPTYAEIEAAKRLYVEEELEAYRLRSREVYEKITANEKAQRSAHEQTVAKGKAAKSRKRKPGRPPDPPQVKLTKRFVKSLVKKGVCADLADRLVNVLKVDRTFWIAKHVHKLTEDQQHGIVFRIDDGDDLEDAAYRVMKMLEANDEASESVSGDMESRSTFEHPTKH